MGQVYEEHKDEDGFLYIAYSGENTFGHCWYSLKHPFQWRHCDFYYEFYQCFFFFVHIEYCGSVQYWCTCVVWLPFLKVKNWTWTICEQIRLIYMKLNTVKTSALLCNLFMNWKNVQFVNYSTVNCYWSDYFFLSLNLVFSKSWQISRFLYIDITCEYIEISDMFR